jgi:hypothetical protein
MPASRSGEVAAQGSGADATGGFGEALQKAFGDEDSIRIDLDPRNIDPVKVVEALKHLRVNCLQLLDRVQHHARNIAVMGGRLEAVIVGLTVDRPGLGPVVPPELFMKSWDNILMYEREYVAISRISNPALRLARVVVWNLAGDDLSRVAIKPVAVGILEWLLDPEAGLTPQERMDAAKNLDYVDDREVFLEVVGRVSGHAPAAG